MFSTLKFINLLSCLTLDKKHVSHSNEVNM